MIGARLGTYYGAIFFVIGFMLPFWPLWMQSRGLNPKEIGIVMSVGMLIKVLANPVVGSYADRTGSRSGPLVLLSITAAFSFSTFWFADGFWPILITTILFLFCWSPLMPLTETLTMHFDTAGTLDYGRVRLWGSLAFIAAAWGGGWILTGKENNFIYWILLGGTIMVLLCALILPNTRLSPSIANGSLFPLLTVLKDRQFLWLIVSTGLIQTSHIIYYAFGTIHWQRAGYSEAVIGWLWAEGVIAEVILFIWGRPIVSRLGPARLIAIAGFAGLIRWWGTGITDALSALLFLQLLHGATFGAAHLGAIHFIAEHVKKTTSATAQSVYAASVSGIGFSLASLFSGYLYAAYEGGAFIPMAVMAALGGLIALQLRPCQ